MLLYNVPVFIRINVYSCKKVWASNFFLSTEPPPQGPQATEYKTLLLTPGW